MRKRPSISLKVKLAATLLTIVRPNERGELERVIPHEQARKMTADQVISLFHFDHWPIRHADGGPAAPWNLEPRPILEHRRKSAKIDAPQMAKSRRLAGARTEDAPQKPPKPKTVIPGSKASPWRKRMNGHVERRT